MANPLTLIVQDLRPGEATGVARYCGSVIAEFGKRSVPFRLRQLAAREFRVGPLGFGYYARIAWHRATVRPRGIVHSFFWFVVPPTTRILTIYDTFSYADPERVAHPAARRLYRRLWADITQTPDVYVAISEAVRRDVHRVFGVPWERIIVAPIGVDTGRFRPDAGTPPPAYRVEGKQTILHVGHGYRRKGIHHLVEALGQLGAERFRLVRVGPATDPDYVAAYRARAAALGLDLVECGVVPEDALPSYYAHANLLVFPSADEGAGLPPLEAMASGSNVVASDIPAHREMCGDAAFYASADPSSLAKGIEDALTHPRPPEALRAHAEAHSWARTADVYVRLYRETGVSGIP